MYQHPGGTAIPELSPMKFNYRFDQQSGNEVTDAGNRTLYGYLSLIAFGITGKASSIKKILF
jgi:hypothetical protein